jgi:DNA replication protein DnaD
MDPGGSSMRVMMKTDFLKDERLGKRELKVLIVLFAHADKKTKECWPSRKRISELTGIHPPNVSQAIKNLITFKYITKLKSDGTTNRYKIKEGINLIPGEVSKRYPELSIQNYPMNYQMNYIHPTLPKIRI